MVIYPSCVVEMSRQRIRDKGKKQRERAAEEPLERILMNSDVIDFSLSLNRDRQSLPLFSYEEMLSCR